ncbi:hypothetical protein Dda_0143 [Drechslerella dactyloides]|uniref:Uncharacterized protein n=1 Tax=Drechslerella dactyloides TaxID=74499 RepID=A0AAD6J5N5_DREDA|nr:hypothetical protein Dda_0143 [Drechslerella dactyloides]
MEAGMEASAQMDCSPASETSTSGFQSINNPQHTPAGLQTPAPQVSLREYWSDADKYDLLWSVITSTGATLPTLNWSKIRIPTGHTQASAAIIVEDIALGKHHITHPTFTPSNTNTSRGTFGTFGTFSTNSKLTGSKSKKRKLQEDNANTNTPDQPQLATPSLSVSHASTSSSPSPHSEDDNPPAAATEEKPKKPRRRKRSESPIELDLTNPRIRSFLQSEGYMAADGTPVKRKRGRPTKDPFGLSVTLKKQLQRLDPNAPPMKKRGRPRKPFPGADIHLDTDAENNNGDKISKDVGPDTRYEHGNISPSLRSAIEKIGEEMDREVEGMLNESRALERDERASDAEDDEDESDGYEGSVAEAWETYESDEGARVAVAEKKNAPPVGQEVGH